MPDPSVAGSSSPESPLPLQDEKRGNSTMCRRGDHASCKVAKARCSCDCHGRTGQLPPSPKERTMQPERTIRAVPSNDGPSIEVVREDPPARKGGGTGGFIAKLGAALDEVKESPGVWFRVANFPSKTQASGRQAACRKNHPDFSFAARRVDGGSALWARYDG